MKAETIVEQAKIVAAEAVQRNVWVQSCADSFVAMVQRDPQKYGYLVRRYMKQSRDRAKAKAELREYNIRHGRVLE